MTPEQLLLSAVGTLAGVIGILFLWAKDQFTKCQVREEECNKTLLAVLTALARLDPNHLPPVDRRQSPRD